MGKKFKTRKGYDKRDPRYKEYMERKREERLLFLLKYKPQMFDLLMWNTALKNFKPSGKR